MNAKQSNQLEALADTHAFLSSTPVIGALAAMPPKIARLNNHLELIRAAAQVQALPVRGAVRERDQASDAAIELTLVVAGALRSYAATNHLPELLANAAVARSDFHNQRRAERLQLAQQVFDLAQPLAAELAGYGVTAAMLTEFGDKIAAGNTKVLSPRRAVARRKAATRTLGQNFTAAGRLLRDEIDPVIETVRLTDPDTHAAYHDARSVFDRPGVRRADDAPPATANTPAATPADAAKAA